MKVAATGNYHYLGGQCIEDRECIKHIDENRNLRTIGVSIYQDVSTYSDTDNLQNIDLQLVQKLFTIRRIY